VTDFDVENFDDPEPMRHAIRLIALNTPYSIYMTKA
jgi:hypothetical protein